MDNQSEQLEGKEKKQMERELMNLAIRCRLGPMIGCDLSSDDWKKSTTNTYMC